MILKNLTPHRIVLKNSMNYISFEAASIPAEVVFKETTVGTAQHFPIITVTVTETNNLPEPMSGVFLIVSTIVRQANPSRQDLLTPAGLMRDNSGNILAATKLICNDLEKIN
jgi:hypothetical protein